MAFATAYRQRVRELVERSSNGDTRTEGDHSPEDSPARERIAAIETKALGKLRDRERVFPNIDGIRFLTHEGGCGGTRQDAQALCGLLAGYIHHPNVAGATVLSLGCQNAQAAMLMDELRARDPELRKPVLIFDQQNPSPGNIADGLITDAIKSAGAARKGGVAPVRDVLDFPQYATTPGLNLLCTPGNDVECVTAQAGSGANLVLFTTGLGTPTGNPVAPVIKVSTNSTLAERMGDIIDFDAGGIVTGETTIPRMRGRSCSNFALRWRAASASRRPNSLGQNDFIPWKRGVSL